MECNGWDFFNQPLPYGDPDILHEVSYCELDKTTNNCPYLGKIFEIIFFLVKLVQLLEHNKFVLMQPICNF